MGQARSSTRKIRKTSDPVIHFACSLCHWKPLLVRLCLNFGSLIYFPVWFNVSSNLREFTFADQVVLVS